jgi:hypothetical protein
MRQAFEKAAGVVSPQSKTTVRSYAALQKKLKPGDILVASMAPRIHTSIRSSPVGYATESLFRGLSKKLQGGDFTHTAVYTGKGKVTEIRLGEEASEKPLRKALRHLDVKVVRPSVAPQKTRQAVKKLKRMVEEGATYNPKMLVEAAAANFVKMKGKSLKERLDANKVICSNLVSRAYSGVRFSKDKDPELIMPSDFLKSHKTRPILTFRNPGRRDRPS